ncbi:hypothetical protein G6F65_020702 [Rhizopus arrhizus]|nr:hypothetical protein G6F65_020702 [Rhizopus arrhizus]
MVDALSATPAQDGRSDCGGVAQRGHGAIPRALRADAQKPGGVGRNRFRQDDLAEHPFKRDSGRRTGRHHRGRGGVAPEPRSPGGPGGTPRQSGGARTHRYPRTGAQRAAHAAGPDRRR